MKRAIVPWIYSWPSIVVGFLLCFIPGVFLLWRRPGMATRSKLMCVVAAAAVFIVIGIALPDDSKNGPDRGTQDAPANANSPRTEPSPTPQPSVSSPAGTPTAARSGSAISTAGSATKAALALVVKGRSAKTGYTRDQFGRAWVDVNRNGCDTRNDMLIKYLTARTMAGSCKVLAGTLRDPYTGTTIRFVRGGASEVDIDHIVALSDAWQKGARAWPYAKRVAFANDPLNLQPTDAGANRQKGDSDIASWQPPNKPYRCTYAARQVAVKKKYRVWVTRAERDILLAVLSKCPGQALPSPGSQPTIASNVGGPPPSSTTSAAPKPTSGGGSTDPRFGTCRDANAAGYGPYYQGNDPEYYWYQDRDHDGSVCE